jgi:hypothetical protein
MIDSETPEQFVTVMSGVAGTFSDPSRTLPKSIVEVDSSMHAAEVGTENWALTLPLSWGDGDGPGPDV